jgi:hypothetical protein
MALKKMIICLKSIESITVEGYLWRNSSGVILAKKSFPSEREFGFLVTLHRHPSLHPPLLLATQLLLLPKVLSWE